MLGQRNLSNGKPTSRVHVKASEKTVVGRRREEYDLRQSCSATFAARWVLAFAYIWAGVVPSYPAEFAGWFRARNAGFYSYPITFDPLRYTFANFNDFAGGFMTESILIVDNWSLYDQTRLHYQHSHMLTHGLP